MCVFHLRKLFQSRQPRRAENTGRSEQKRFGLRQRLLEHALEKTNVARLILEESARERDAGSGQTQAARGENDVLHQAMNGGANDKDGVEIALVCRGENAARSLRDRGLARVAEQMRNEFLQRRLARDGEEFAGEQ